MVFEIPEALRESKETWFRIFSTQSLLATLVFASVGFIFRLIFKAFGLSVLGWIVFGLFAVTGYLLFTIRISSTNILHGGGLLLAQKLWKTILHRRNRAIYITIFNDDEDDVVYEEVEEE